MKNENQEANDLDWVTPDSGEDFFSDLDEESVVEESNKVGEGEESEKEEEPADKESEDFFEEGTTEEEDDSKDEGDFVEKAISNLGDDLDSETTPENDTPTKSVLRTLKNRGILEFSDEEDFEKLDEVKAGDLLEDKLDARVEEELKDLIKDLPESLRHAYEFVANGGTFEQFMETAYKTPAKGITKDLDISLEANQEMFLKSALAEEGYTPDEIESQIEYFKDKDKLSTQTEKRFDRWVKKQEEAEKNLASQQREANRNQVLMERAARDNALNFLKENEQIGEITIPPSERQDLVSFMNDKTVKLTSGANVTNLQKVLFLDIPKNTKAMMQLAALVKNRNEDGTFNFDSIIKTNTTKFTKRVKDSMRRTENTVPNKSKNGSKPRAQQRSLGDYFN